jgi:hypothetical protein
MADITNADTLLVLLTLHYLVLQLDELQFSLCHLLYLHDKEERQLARFAPLQKSARRTWEEFTNMIVDDLFWRMFRMTKETFRKLCHELESVVGKETFKAKEYLLCNGWSLGLACTRKANEYKGGIVPGEMKVAIALRMLAGASYLDLIVAYGIDRSFVYLSLFEVVGWINTAFSLPLVNALQNKDMAFFQSISDGFASFTSGIFKRCIGAIDGIAIRINCPPESEVPDPKNYWCRKGFYALNVQAICDSKKRILWVIAQDTKGQLMIPMHFLKRRYRIYYSNWLVGCSLMACFSLAILLTLCIHSFLFHSRAM